jgi:transcriptional regulator with GAF, ATPase, and Fis domain
MKDVLRVLAAGGKEEEALQRSFADAAEGFGAAKALLLLVESEAPLQLRSLCAVGLTDAQVAACERGESIDGVSSSVIRGVVKERRVRLLDDPALAPETDQTPALPGRSGSVLCSPVLDPIRNRVLAVVYLQNARRDAEATYGQSDAEWLEGYAAAVGQAFALYFQEESRQRELRELLQGAQRPENAPELIGDSEHTRALRRMLHETYIPACDAPDPDPILILGEKGTGKDLVARYLHTYGARRDRPFLAVNCAELTDEMAAARFFGHKRGAFTGALADEPGFFRAAHRGVLFLDEIAELSLRAQGTLLRVLESRTVVAVGETRETRVDVQVLLATNHDLDAAVAAGAMKADFLDRFRAQVVRLQPLRERPRDIPDLVQHFVSHHERRTRKRTLGIAQEALRLLVAYPWPGNVRELARVCSLLVTHAKHGARLDVPHLERCYPELVKAAEQAKSEPIKLEDVSLREAVTAFRRELVLARLERHHWDLAPARESLKLPRTTLLRYMAELGITPRE